MAHTVAERRAAPRIRALGCADIARGRLRPGRPAHIVDVSAGGALIETECRLLPGTRVELQLGEPIVLHTVKGRVLRCHVAVLDGGHIRYRGALVFEEQLTLSGNETTHG